MASQMPMVRVMILPTKISANTHTATPMDSCLAIITPSLSPYTREFFDCLAQNRRTGITTLFIGQRESDWINPWNTDLLTPQVADCYYANESTAKQSGRLILPIRSLIAAVERLNPSLVAVQECSLYCVSVVAWALIRGIPYLLITELGDDYGPPYPPLSLAQKCTHRIILNGSAGIIALSPDAQRRAEKAGKRYVLAPHSINTARCLPGTGSDDASGPVVFMTAGNFIYRKGYDLLIKAFALMQENLAGGHPWVLRCYGAGDSADLHALARISGIAAMVEFHSFLDEAALVSAYQSADVFVFPSRKETYGIVLHEAAACGLPLVASIYAGATELLACEGENAFRIDPENTSQFASALEIMLRDKNLRYKFGANSRSIAEHWDVEVNAQRVSSWIKQTTT